MKEKINKKSKLVTVSDIHLGWHKSNAKDFSTFLQELIDKSTSSLAAEVDLDHNGLPSEPGEPYIDPHTITFKISYMPESPSVDPVYTSAKITDLPEEGI
jgi:hypothetical protein